MEPFEWMYKMFDERYYMDLQFQITEIILLIVIYLKMLL